MFFKELLWKGIKSQHILVGMQYANAPVGINVL